MSLFMSILGIYSLIVLGVFLIGCVITANEDIRRSFWSVFIVTPIFTYVLLVFLR